MMKHKRRPMAALMTVVVACGGMTVLLVAGCSHKEDAPPANYYTGPITPKSSGNPVLQQKIPAKDVK